jgi:hypothetical protein
MEQILEAQALMPELLLVDTDVIIDYLRGQVDAVTYIESLTNTPKLNQQAAQQGAATDRLQLRSSFLLAALPAAGELGRCVAAPAWMKPCGLEYSGRRYIIALNASTRVGASVADALLFSRGVLVFWSCSVSVLTWVLVSA